MNTHIRYEASKKLKEFLGDSAPEPMCHEYFTPNGDVYYRTRIPREEKEFPMYRLHDLLSKPLLQAFTAKRKDMQNSEVILWPEVTGGYLYKQYLEGGMPAVEKALLEMMEESK